MDVKELRTKAMMSQPFLNNLLDVSMKYLSYFIDGDSSQLEFLVPWAEVESRSRPLHRPYLHSSQHLRTYRCLCAS